MSENTATADDKAKTIEQEVELEEKDIDMIADKAADKVAEKATKEIEKNLGTLIQDAIETADKAKAEKLKEEQDKAAKAAKADPARKDIENAEEIDENDPIAKAIEAKKFGKDVSEMNPAMRFYKQMRTLIQQEDGEGTKELKELNRYGLASQLKARAADEQKGMQHFSTKTGYANETTATDGAVLVPDADFITEVFDNLPKYGVAFSDANVRQTDRTAVRVISLDSGLTFYATAEAGVKTAAKLTFSKNEVSLQKYAVIVPATDELTEDAAIDFWNLVTRELSRAYAKKADEVVFTDAAGSASGSGGITNQTGVLTHTIGASFDWDDLLTGQGKTEDDLDESNAKWYMRKETWYYLVMRRADAVTAADGSGAYLAGSLNTATGWVANPNQPTTPWGTEVKFTRVLPTINTVSANDAFAVYGDLKNYLLFNKRGMALKMLTEATIVDADEVTTNLATQDISAMRAVVRLLGILPKGNRTKFVVVGKGTVS